MENSNDKSSIPPFKSQLDKQDLDYYLRLEREADQKEKRIKSQLDKRDLDYYLRLERKADQKKKQKKIAMIITKIAAAVAAIGYLIVGGGGKKALECVGEKWDQENAYEDARIAPYIKQAKERAEEDERDQWIYNNSNDFNNEAQTDYSGDSEESLGNEEESQVPEQREYPKHIYGDE